MDRFSLDFQYGLSKGAGAGIVTLSGTPLEVGMGIGDIYKTRLHESVKKAAAALPKTFPKRLVDPTLHEAWKNTVECFPVVAEEIAGVSTASGVSLPDLMLILHEEFSDAHKCTDVVATGKATKAGSTLMGHNNDQDRDEGTPFPIRLAVEGQPEVLAFTYPGGVAYMAGANSAGIVLSGNTLTSWDVQWGGIPRLILVRAALQARSIDAALRILLHPKRASSYNNVIADTTGRVVDAEATGRKKAVVEPDGVYSHTNHFIIPDLYPYEGKKDDIKSTQHRLIRSRQLLEAGYGKHTVETFKTILRDHENKGIESICRHDRESVTGFSAVFEPQRQVIWYCQGNPCKGTYVPLEY